MSVNSPVNQRVFDLPHRKVFQTKKMSKNLTSDIVIHRINFTAKQSRHMKKNIGLSVAFLSLFVTVAHLSPVQFVSSGYAEPLEEVAFEVYRLEGSYRFVGPETEVSLASGEMRSYSFHLPIRTVIRKVDGNFSLQADGTELFVRRTGELPEEGIPFAVRL